MPILGITTSVTGLVGIAPRIVYIQTNDTTATVTTAGYLNHAVQEGFSFTTLDMALVNTTDAGGTVTWYQVTFTKPNWSLEELSSAIIGNLNVTGSIHAGTTITAGTGITSTAGNITAAAGSISAFTTITAGTGITSTTGAITATAGNVIAGSAGNAGLFRSFPAVSGGANDFFAFRAITSGGNFATTISNSVMGQSSTISVPDPGAATANFLLDTGTGNLVTDYQQMIPLSEFLLAAAGGVFVQTRNAQGNWSQTKVAGADTSLLAFDITEQLRAAAGFGFELVSFDVIYSIGTLALNANAVTLSSTVFANNLAVAVTNVAITGALATATQAQPYLTNITVNAPAFSNPAAGTSVKQVIDISVNAAATSAYAFYGINLRFTKSIK